jgi:hypothetical protein
MTRRLSLVLAVVLAFGLVSLAAAQQQDQPKAAPNPLVQLLQSKGVLTAQEAAAINQAATPAEQQDRLTQLLYSKGIITQDEYKQTAAAERKMVLDAQGTLLPAAGHVSAAEPDAAMAAAPQKPAAPAVIPAVAPIRVLQLEPSKQGGMVPDITLGSKAKLKLYGFFKSTAVYDTSSPGGNDFPLPGFLGDTGPDGSPEFHIKARAARFGSNFEWPDLAGSNNTLTGRLEFDWEGNFTRANNRNISSIRSSQPSLRLAYMRIDHKFSDQTSAFALFGQDWVPFGSSVLPAMLETTGNGIGFGSIYTRDPQFRFGVYHNFGGPRNFTVGIEPAIVLPAFGNLPASPVDNQLAFGERQGVDSQQPQLEGRLVFQFQADTAKGVAPAQIVFSGMHATRRAIVLAAAVPAAFKPTFPNGATVDSSRSGWTAGIQLPTRYATLVANYYNGSDLRWYFAGQVFSNFNDPRVGVVTTSGGAIPCTAAACAASATSIDGSSTVLFGFLGTTPVVVPQSPVRAVGGFAQVSFPLSRIFNANPAGRNAGWALSFLYGMDQAKARDVRFFNANGARNKGDMSVANLTYKMNGYVTFGYESSLYRTRSTCNTPAPTTEACSGTIFRGLAARSWHDWRNEFGPTFTF